MLQNITSRKSNFIPENPKEPKMNHVTINFPLDIFVYPHVELPNVWTVEQKFDTPALTIAEIEEQTRSAVREIVRNIPAKNSNSEPKSVAVGVGSRGLDNLVPTVR